MRRKKFKVILNSNERSNLSIKICTHTQPMMMLTSSGSSSLSIQLVHGVNWFQFTDSEDLTENSHADELYTTKNCISECHYTLIHPKWHHTTDVSWLDGSHHVTSTRAIIRCNKILFKNNNIKPVPKLANRFAESLQSWKRRATVKSSQYNIHVAWIMFLLAHVIITTDGIKWTYLPTTVRLRPQINYAKCCHCHRLSLN